MLAAVIQRHHHEVEREELLAEMRLAVAGRDRAVSIVAHDLGNPLSTREQELEFVVETDSHLPRIDADPRPPSADQAMNGRLQSKIPAAG